MVELSREQLLEIYKYMLLTRIADEITCELYTRRGLPELPHSSMGQEAVAIGACYALKEGDYVLPSLRARGMFYVKGIPCRIMMAGMFAKATGPARAKSTSHHMGDLKRGILAGSGLVGSSIPIAVGAGLALKKSGRPNVVLTSFGDGATNTGAFHESMNLASIWDLPVIFVCENNGYAISTEISKAARVEKLSIRAASYGMPGVTVDGNNVLTVYEAVYEAAERARKGEGPSFIECITYRWRGHSERDRGQYRSEDEIERWRQQCPIKRFEEHLQNLGLIDVAEIRNIREEVKATVLEAVRFADESPYPNPEEALTNVYAD